MLAYPFNDILYVTQNSSLQEVIYYPCLSFVPAAMATKLILTTGNQNLAVFIAQITTQVYNNSADIFK